MRITRPASTQARADDVQMADNCLQGSPQRCAAPDWDGGALECTAVAAQIRCGARVRVRRPDHTTGPVNRTTELATSCSLPKVEAPHSLSRAVRDRDSGFVNCDFREAADAESGVTVSTSVVVTDQGVSRGTPLGVDASVVPLTNVIRTQAFAQIPYTREGAVIRVNFVNTSTAAAPPPIVLAPIFTG